MPGAPPNRPVNLVGLLEGAGGIAEGEEIDDCLKGVGDEGGVFWIEFLFKNC